MNFGKENVSTPSKNINATPRLTTGKKSKLPENKEPLRVVMRTRDHPNSCVEVVSDTMINIKMDPSNNNNEPKQTYTFSKVFAPKCGQKEVKKKKKMQRI